MLPSFSLPIASTIVAATIIGAADIQMAFRISFKFLLLCPLVLVAAPADSAPRPVPRELSCTGPFAREATYAGMVKAFGRNNVKTESVGIGEGEMARATVIFARDKARRIEIFWRDAKKRRGLAEMRISTGSTWRTTQGVAVGMPLVDVEAINGRPFLLAGFGWDYGGTTLDWKDGKLATQPGGCRLMLRFDQQKPTDADIDGDREFSSDDKGMRSAAPIVEEISFRFE